VFDLEVRDQRIGSRGKLHNEMAVDDLFADLVRQLFDVLRKRDVTVGICDACVVAAADRSDRKDVVCYAASAR
jgi:hypothetical protein